MVGEGQGPSSPEFNDAQARTAHVALMSSTSRECEQPSEQPMDWTIMDACTRPRTRPRGSSTGWTPCLRLVRRRSQRIEQRPGRALNVPTTAVGPGHSRVQAERHSARRPGALGISQVPKFNNCTILQSDPDGLSAKVSVVVVDK